jgi:hypothetical protein
MKHLKYKVSIPVPNTHPEEYKDFFFYDRKEVCDFLEISINTFIYITSGEMKHAHNSKKYLSKVHIERLEVPKISKPERVETKKVVKESPDVIAEKYFSKLIEKQGSR